MRSMIRRAQYMSWIGSRKVKSSLKRETVLQRESCVVKNEELTVCRIVRGGR